MRDITDRKRAEENLIRLERFQALKELSKGISHNLNNILVTILAPADIIRNRVDSPELQCYATMIYESSLRAVDVVKRLHWAVQDGYEEEVTKVNPNEVVAEVESLIHSYWNNGSKSEGASIQVETNLEDVSSIWGTPSGLQTILVALSLNAIDAMPNGGKITIETRQETRQETSGVRVRFSDNGVGMGQEIRMRVFEPFFTTKQDVGSGLGLSSCHRTITGWGGTIDVESEPGEGTTFEMWFPHRPED